MHTTPTFYPALSRRHKHVARLDFKGLGLQDTLGCGTHVSPHTTETFSSRAVSQLRLGGSTASSGTTRGRGPPSDGSAPPWTGRPTGRSVGTTRRTVRVTPPLNATPPPTRNIFDLGVFWRAHFAPVVGMGRNLSSHTSGMTSCVRLKPWPAASINGMTTPTSDTPPQLRRQVRRELDA
jgi:hypothetical protein